MISEKIQLISEKIKLLESLKEHQFSKSIAAIHTRILDTLLSQNFNPRIAPYLSKINKEGEPYTNYDLNPDNISQIKKLINALYYARLALEDIEQIDLKGRTYSSLKLLYQNTIHKAYQACYLLTHLDVDVREMFSEELQLLLPLAGKLMAFADSHSEDTKKLAESLREYPLSYKIGEITGTAVDQMQPNSADLDYKFLTQFGAVLPSYIDQFTQYIKEYSSEIIEKEPSLNNEKLEELQTTALKLLNDLENLKGNSLFLSFKVLNYIHIMRNILTLSKSTIEQMGHFSQSSQDVIRSNLAQLKYVLLPSLFGFVDKIENNTMLKPGTLSNPLMEKIKPLYALLIHYASKPVDFQVKGEELLSIEDSRFLALRLEKSYGRIDAANKALFKIQKAEDALSSFYEILENPLYKNSALNQLPPEIKNQLITHYKLIKPYMMQKDFDLNSKIIDSLKGPESYFSMAGRPLRWLRKQLPADHVRFIIEHKNTLQDLISKKRATQIFHINLNMDLINSVNKQTNLVLFPYNNQTNVFSVDESEAVKQSDTCALLRLTNQYTLKSIPKIQFEPQTLYLEETLKGLKYDVLNPQGKRVSAIIPWDKISEFPHNVSDILASKEKFLPTLLELTADAGHTKPTDKLNLCAMEKHDPQTLYIETTDKGLKYEVISPEGQLETAIISWKKLNNVPHDVSLILASKEQYLPRLQEVTSAAGHTLNSTELKFDEIKTLLKGRSAVILFNNKELIYADPVNQTVSELKPSETNKTSFNQLKAVCTQAYQVAGEKELELVTDVTGRRHLGFKEVRRQQVLSTPNNLSADQALDLHQWYRNKRDKFKIAQNAYNEFIALLKKQVAVPGMTGSGALYISNMDKTVKARCRNLYNLFQPYFINGVPSELKAAALEFDKYLVHSFSGDTEQSPAPATDLFHQLDEHFQIYFTDIDSSWRTKSNAYLKLAQKKFAAENEESSLTHDATIGNRGHHLIKHTNYSKYAHNFRTELYKVILALNQSMQAELRPQKDGIPFPELEDPKQLAAQCKQVLAIKRIFNSLFHVEGIILELEELDNRSYQTNYVRHLLLAYGHIDEIMKLTKNLINDPHFSLIGRELLEKAQGMYASIQEHSDPYQVAHTEVNYDKPVQFNGLWYALNAFNISPKHIRSLRNNNFLTVEELNELHVSAKRSAVQIESIINSAGSYFQLFLQVPNMFSLYGNLTSKLNEFISTVHDTVINNLDQFGPKIFTPMLLEADLWEDKLGLIPGTLSGPLKQIIDEFYKGLLRPLDLDAKTHVDLICDKATLAKRLEITQQKIDSAEQHLEKLDKNYKHINNFFSYYKNYQSLTGGLLPADPRALSSAKQELLKAYNKALPKLVVLQNKVTLDPEKIDPNFDNLLNSGLKDYQPKLSQIKELFEASQNYYQGIKATYQMQLNTAREKLTYLTELNRAQDQANLLFIQEYTTESFNKQMEAFCNRHIGLQYTDKEYRNKLREYLLTFKDTIINEAKTTDDINLTVKNLLKEKIKLFEQDNFAKYFHLDTVRVALAQFKNYFSISTLAIERNYSLFENEKTLGEKTEKINKLLEFAENEHLTIDERFSKIAFDVKDPSFGRIILAHKQEDHFSFTYLIHCVVSILEALSLYTPARKRLYNSLQESVNNKPQINELAKRFGLFATSQTPAPLPSRAPEAPTDGEENNDDAAPTITASI
ncbi:SdhA, substrate of the Dot/Icm system [Legionella moravica]|uniref:SdhA, GRIP coiled-coil protein GCC185 n=1 Tax=Legionella moravica TaxID=39962 RepID=A0A378JS17_9GAMM|nr:SdhA, substrate of the Dot/Icm system [Legionella moravica]STX61413.1 SdhA, GRIP coiled-coil protein GCC185 [Legionella moravica]